MTIVTLFGDTPRALAVSPDGATVYAAVFHSGNRTTTLNEGLVCDTSQTNLKHNAVQGSCSVNGVAMPGGLPLPHRDTAGEVRPETALIVKFNGTNWVDQLGRNWNNAVKFSLPDRDVFKIDANATPPVAVSGGAGSFVGVGTVLFNMVANPVSGKVYVTNSEARNEVRFEGPGTTSTTVQGHLHEARITVLDGTNVLPRHLNKHINYALRPAPAGTKEKSLATPLGMAITSDGATLYVAALGSNSNPFRLSGGNNIEAVTAVARPRAVAAPVHRSMVCHAPQALRGHRPFHRVKASPSSANRSL
jgi:DNA-binding beta-propeller fold protein YncE